MNVRMLVIMLAIFFAGLTMAQDAAHQAVQQTGTNWTSAAALIAMIYLNCSNLVIPFTGW